MRGWSAWLRQAMPTTLTVSFQPGYIFGLELAAARDRANRIKPWLSKLTWL